MFKRSALVLFLLFGLTAFLITVSAQTTVTINAEDYSVDEQLSPPAGVSIVAYPNGDPDSAQTAYATEDSSCASFGEISAIAASYPQATLFMVFGFDNDPFGIGSNWSTEAYTFEVRFSGTASQVSIDVITDNIATLEAFDESDALVDSTSFSGEGTLTVTGDDNIKVARVTMSKGRGDFGCLNHLSITYTSSEGEPEDVIYLCNKPFSVYGMVQVNAPIIGYGQPGKDEIRLADGTRLPVLKDDDGNGYDTYLIIDSQIYEEETWYGLFLGGCDPVYVLADEVQRLR